MFGFTETPQCYLRNVAPQFAQTHYHEGYVAVGVDAECVRLRSRGEGVLNLNLPNQAPFNEFTKQHLRSNTRGIFGERWNFRS
jgi:hypothetical protein